MLQGVLIQQEPNESNPTAHVHNFTPAKHQLSRCGTTARRYCTDRRSSESRRERWYEAQQGQTGANRGNEAGTIERNIRIHERDIDIQDSELVASVHGIDLDVDIARARADRLHPTLTIGLGLVGQTTLPAAADAEGAALLPVLWLAIGGRGDGGRERLREDADHAVALGGV